jgi:hypothetical protein
MSGLYEQKYLLYNWSDCRYRDRPQSPRVVLSVRPSACDCPEANDKLAGPSYNLGGYYVFQSHRCRALSGKTGFALFSNRNKCAGSFSS